MNVTVRNVITSMRLISWFDWAEFVESVSLVDEVLRARQPLRARWTSRPATATGTPSRSSPAARDGPSSRSPTPRGADGRSGAARRRRPADVADAARVADPGYYLIADGRAGARTRARRPGAAVATGCGAPMPAPATRGYLGTLALVTALVLAVRSSLARARRDRAPALLVVALLALVPASDLAVALVNRVVTDARSARGRCRASTWTTACRPSCGRWSWSRRC